MRIAIACHTPAHLGGVESYIATLVPALVARGHRVALFYEGEAAAPTPVAECAWSAEAGADRAIENLKAWAPDVIFLQGLKEDRLEGRLLGVAPTVLFAHSYYGTCISGAKLHAVPSAARCSRVFGAPCLALYHPRRCGGLGLPAMVRMYRQQGRRQELLRSFAAVVVASRHMHAEYSRHGLAARTHVVPLPPTLPPGSPANRTEARVYRLACVGRLEWTKGADLALEAAARASRHVARPVNLRIVGRGPLEASLRRHAAALCAGESRLDVEFTGWVGRERLAEILDATDLLLVASRWPEPFGLVGVEAGLRGVPAVAFDAGGIPDWLEHGVNGLLVRGRPMTADRFAGAIIECVASDDALARMRIAARERAQTFTLARHVEQLEAVLAAAAGRTAVAP